MPIQILMPALSPTMTEGNLAKWLKREGDKVKAGEVIAEIETDKAVMEVEAVDAGVLHKILVNENSQNVAVNQVLAILLEEGEEAESINNLIEADRTIEVTSAVSGTIDLQLADGTKLQTSCTKIIDKPTNDTVDQKRIFASPLAKRIAAQNNIDIAHIIGSGPHGRVVKDDVLAVNAKLQDLERESKNVDNVMPVANQILPTVADNSDHRNPVEYTISPNSNMRKIIAKRLCESKQNIPHFYLSIDCELDNLLAIRQQLNSAATAQHNYKLSVNDFVIKAVAHSLKHVPEANASWTEAAIKYYNNIDISVAVAIEGGLITPIIKNANLKTISQISNEMKELAKRARENKLAPQEFQGGNFSISNLGMYNIKQFNAIINPPQSCILAVGAGNEQVIAKNGVMQIANIMNVTLSCDHRVVDGAIGAKFLDMFKNFIEQPITMFI